MTNITVSIENYESYFRELFHDLYLKFASNDDVKLNREFQEWIYANRLHSGLTKYYATFQNLFDDDIKHAILLCSK